MTEVMNTCDSAVGDFGVAGTPGDQSISFKIFPESHERFPKLPKRLPSIVVEPTKSGELDVKCVGLLSSNYGEEQPGDTEEEEDGEMGGASN